MKALGMVALAAALAAAAWWWFTIAIPQRAQERAEAAEAAAIQARRMDTLYRWRDDAGNLQVTQEPPQGRRYERVSKTPKDGIEVSGERQ